MDELTFVPSSGEFFLWSSAAAGPRATVAVRLQAAGWPGPAQLARGEALDAPIEGILIEMIDALPILAAAAEEPGLSPGLRLWSAAARMALDMLRRGRLLPRLRARRGRGDDERVSGWEARWVASLVGEDRARYMRLCQSLISAEVAVPTRRFGRDERERGPAYTPAGLLRRFLDLAADILVREATRRGAYVRIGGWPADAWEQRLVRALVDDRAGFYVPEHDPAALAREVKTWADDQAVSPTLLPSPPSWQAGESLQQVLERMIAPVRFLTERMLAGEPAPRTLSPAVISPRGRLSQAIAVTRTAVNAQRRLKDTGTDGKQSGQG